MNVIPVIFFPGIIGLIIFTVAFFKYPRYAIAGLIIAKPIIDVSWDYNIFLNINFLKLYAGLFVILGAIYIIYHRPKILRHPISIIWLVFLGLNIISIFIISDAYLLFGKISYFLRILTGFVALIMFAHLLNFEKDKKFVLSIFIIAGIFPILLWLIPVIIGNPIISNDPLRRIMGPYHDFKVFMYVTVQTIICCLAYLALSSRHCEPEHSEGVATLSSSGVEPLGSSKSASSSSHCEERSDAAISTTSQPHSFLFSKLHSIIKSPFLRFSVSPGRMMAFIMLIVSVAMVYKCYSKAGWITLGAIFFIWFLLRKKYIFAVSLPVIAAIIIFVSPFAKDFQKTFNHEIGYFVHNSDTKERVFRGRLSRWEKGMVIFGDMPVVNKLFGATTPIGSPENAYVRTLWDSGVVGLVVFVTLLGLTGYVIINKYIKDRVPVILMGICVFAVFFVSSIGEHPMFFPNLQWFIWGTAGFILGEQSASSKEQSVPMGQL